MSKQITSTGPFEAESKEEEFLSSVLDPFLRKELKSKEYSYDEAKREFTYKGTRLIIKVAIVKEISKKGKRTKVLNKNMPLNQMEGVLWGGGKMFLNKPGHELQKYESSKPKIEK